MNITSIANRLLIIAVLGGAWYGLGQAFIHFKGPGFDEDLTGPVFTFAAAPLLGLLFAILAIVCLVGVAVVAVLLWELVAFIEKETFGRLRKWAVRRQELGRMDHWRNKERWRDRR
jgi:hypothetical protein